MKKAVGYLIPFMEKEREEMMALSGSTEEMVSLHLIRINFSFLVPASDSSWFPALPPGGSPYFRCKLKTLSLETLEENNGEGREDGVE